MSKTLTFEIHTADVLNEVKMTTHYTAQKENEDGSAFEHIATIDANDEKIRPYIKSGHLALVATMTRWVTKHNITAAELPDVAEYVLTLPDNVDDAQTAIIGTTAKEYLVCRALRDWFGMLKMEKEEQSYAQEGEEKLSIINNAIYSRVRKPRHYTLPGQYNHH